MLNFDRLQTPPNDGDILVEPTPADWPAMIEAGHGLCPGGLTLAGHSVSNVRRQIRRTLWGVDHAVPVIACGHQPAHIHPGVWAKNVAVARMIGQLGLAGGDLIVDHDTPHAHGLTVPAAGPDGLIHLHALTWGEESTNTAYEGRPALSHEELASAERHLRQWLDKRFAASAIPDYLEGAAQAGPPCDLVNQHMAGRARVDAALGAALHAVRVSAAFGGPFLADLLLNADRFAAAYNDALADYRTVQRVRSPQRPLPDLGREADCFEAALWIYQPGQRRHRLWTRRVQDTICLYADREEIERIDAHLLAKDPSAALAALSPWVIRPRALTLTLWARLLACDLFVHGIGGAKYDRITDRIFRTYYGIEPPPIACVSATLRLPLPRHPRAEAELRVAHHRLRDLAYNPQRYLGGPAELLAERSALIEQSARLRAQAAPRAPRREVYLDIHRTNSALLESEPDLLERFQTEVERLTREHDSHRLAEGREYFYALQPRQRLIDLAKQLADTLTSGSRSADTCA